MIELKCNELGIEESEWHNFKTILVLGHYDQLDEVNNMYNLLSDSLKENKISKIIKKYLDTKDKSILNKAANLLVGGFNSWLVLERL